ncbi:MAG TPA: LamG-like jellyroll fold domain-containing protein, partial [Saprospiraceae bacterium]|nr:LamG-like jellyroll fold domain-containing protein [Saprospiraceae bacterium]
MKSLIAVFCMLLSIFVLNAQEKPVSHFYSADSPPFISLIQSESPNVFEVEKAYREYYLEIPFEKNSYTQFYKRWMYWAQRNMDNQGAIRERSDLEWEQEERTRIQLRKVHPSKYRNQAPEWTFAGPNRTFHTDGQTKVTWQTNIYSMDVALTNPSLLYAGGEDGGLWKTIDQGRNWILTTKNVLHASFGAVKIHPVHHDTVYAGTSGKIMQSTDGGKTWSTVYSESGIFIHDLAISRSQGFIVLAATNKGLLRSSNSGKSWDRIYPMECWTIRSKVNDPKWFYAVIKEGSGSRFLRSSDHGLTWTDALSGWYQPGTGITVTGAHIAVCPSNPAKLYTYLCGSGGNLGGYIGVFSSLDEGQNWSNTNPANAIGGPYSIPDHTNLMAHNGTDGFNQGFYDMAIIVNPKNENQLIAGGTSWFKSIDGGARWTALGGYVGGLSWSHPDLQCLVAQGDDLWIGSDGGINYSKDFGQTIEARMDGISGANLWGFDAGWNEDILVGGRYHNGNMAWHESFPAASFYRMGGAESATGYVNPGPGRKTYFSDIGGYALKGGWNSGVSAFPVGLFPNESYAYYANSQMVWHPQCWNHIYLGRDQKIWKSTDGGSSFTLLYSFPGTVDNKVFEIEISRSDPSVMYCTQFDGTDDAIWKSSDGGASWVKTSPLPLPNNNDRAKISMSATDPMVLWVAITYGSNGKKVYKTIDGGKSWINWTTPVLDNVRVSDLVHQMGTDGGVYLGTNRGVFYRNELMTDWQAYATGLPVSAETNRLKPFYRDGKIRNGCWGFGVWENELFESSRVIPQAMADKLESRCLRDTFYLDDYSVVKHENASWSWSIPDAAFISGEQTRTPKVVFGSTGLKSVIMTLKTPLGSFMDTLSLLVRNECALDPLPGKALSLTGAVGSYAQIPPLGLMSNTITLMAWVKSTAVQKHFAGILFMRASGGAAGLSVLANGDIRYHWEGGGYNWVSRANLEPGVWTHLALVVSPDKVLLYKDGVAYENAVSNNPMNFDAPLAIGADLNGSDRFFKGLIDEVCTYDRALSQDEIREIMHLSRTHTNRSGLYSYHQFNEENGPILDGVRVFHGSLNGAATRVTSTAPIGPGSSAMQLVRSKGSFSFGQTGLQVDTEDSGVYPNGMLWVTRLDYIPKQGFQPNADTVGPTYWILHNYGTNTSFTAFKNMRFDGIGSLKANTQASELGLYRRMPNADTSQWETLGPAASIQTGVDGSAQFAKPKVQGASQFVVTRPVGDTLVHTRQDGEWNGRFPVNIFPNPGSASEPVFFETSLPERIYCRI